MNFARLCPTKHSDKNSHHDQSQSMLTFSLFKPYQSFHQAHLHNTVQDQTTRSLGLCTAQYKIKPHDHSVSAQHSTRSNHTITRSLHNIVQDQTTRSLGLCTTQYKIKPHDHSVSAQHSTRSNHTNTRSLHNTVQDQTTRTLGLCTT